MAMNHELIAEVLIANNNFDTGSLHHLATGVGAITGVAAGFMLSESLTAPANTIAETSAEVGTGTENHDNSVEVIGGTLAGAALLGAVAYQGVRRYAISSLGRDRYKQLKDL